jgi:hypothetical protein
VPLNRSHTIGEPLLGSHPGLSGIIKQLVTLICSPQQALKTIEEPLSGSRLRHKDSPSLGADVARSYLKAYLGDADRHARSSNTPKVPIIFPANAFLMTIGVSYSIFEICACSPELGSL